MGHLPRIIRIADHGDDDAGATPDFSRACDVGGTGLDEALDFSTRPRAAIDHQ
jgi:hypothetical protein